MYRLILDSANKTIYLGLVYNDTLLQEIYTKESTTNNLVFYLDNLLKRHQVSIDDLSEIIVGHGPGSYTGVRTACVVAKMLATTKNILLKSVSSLYMMGSYSQATYQAVMVDARHQCCFCAIYKQQEMYLEDQYLPVEEFYEKFSDLENVEIIREKHYQVDYKKVILMALKVENPHQFVPKYLREVEAVTKLNHAK